MINFQLTDVTTIEVFVHLRHEKSITWHKRSEKRRTCNAVQQPVFTLSPVIVPLYIYIYIKALWMQSDENHFLDFPLTGEARISILNERRILKTRFKIHLLSRKHNFNNKITKAISVVWCSVLRWRLDLHSTSLFSTLLRSCLLLQSDVSSAVVKKAGKPLCIVSCDRFKERLCLLFQ